MENLALFRIGFQCESVCDALLNYKKSNTPLSERIIDESLGVINSCIELETNGAAKFLSKPNATSEFIPIIFEAFPGTGLEGIFEEIKGIAATLKMISKGQMGLDVDKSIAFFKEVSKLCLRRNTRFGFGNTPFNILADTLHVR